MCCAVYPYVWIVVAGFVMNNVEMLPIFSGFPPLLLFFFLLFLPKSLHSISSVAYVIEKKGTSPLDTKLCGERDTRSKEVLAKQARFGSQL